MKVGLLWFSQSTAWYCVFISVFAVIILGVIASLFHSGHESMVGRIDDPPTDAIPAVVSTISAAIFVYALQIDGIALRLRHGLVRVNPREQMAYILATKATQFTGNNGNLISFQIGTEQWYNQRDVPRYETALSTLKRTTLYV
ncbi:unnamed protein product [Parascedosporium putredinis]|uniref:Uncharacterized protein n=1 Tax=Parascedosporium putredinis TaxID=1442378 RepID=A0A9P1H793_9PEZI|nr:unnamed protein product [Parascedosporium putredinis]CAI7998444.1 unnamed protein product [Parascedosporium putredinis]